MNSLITVYSDEFMLFKLKAASNTFCLETGTELNLSVILSGFRLVKHQV